MAKHTSMTIAALTFVFMAGWQTAVASESSGTTTDSQTGTAVQISAEPSFSSQSGLAGNQNAQATNFRWQLQYNLSARVASSGRILDSFKNAERHADIFDIQTAEESNPGH
jgi:hypothetical protein